MIIGDNSNISKANKQMNKTKTTLCVSWCSCCMECTNNTEFISIYLKPIQLSIALNPFLFFFCANSKLFHKITTNSCLSLAFAIHMQKQSGQQYTVKFYVPIVNGRSKRKRLIKSRNLLDVSHLVCTAANWLQFYFLVLLIQNTKSQHVAGV